MPNASPKTVTFGEIMLRLSTPGFQRFVQAQQFDVTYGGGEANVAVALANYGCESYFFSKLPKHEIGQATVNQLRRFGVRTDYIVRGGDRVGVYFLETGASQRGSKVIYDRADSAVTTLTTGEIDLGNVFDGASWFHWTGITPALGETPSQTLIAACKAAKNAGATVSCDLNYRGKLWTEEEAQETMRPLMEYVDVCIANEEDAEKSLGFKAGTSDVHAAELEEEAYLQLAKELKKSTISRPSPSPCARASRPRITAGAPCSTMTKTAASRSAHAATTSASSTASAAATRLRADLSTGCFPKRIPERPWSLPWRRVA